MAHKTTTNIPNKILFADFLFESNLHIQHFNDIKCFFFIFILSYQKHLLSLHRNFRTKKNFHIPRQPFPFFFVYFADINFKMIYKQHKSIPIVQAQFIASHQLRDDSNLYRRNILRLYGAVSNRPLQLNLHTISNNIKPINILNH